MPAPPVAHPPMRPDFVPSFGFEGRGYRIRVIGRCLGCGSDIVNVPDLPVLCDCWDEPPPEFGIEPPPTLE